MRGRLVREAGCVGHCKKCVGGVVPLLAGILVRRLLQRSEQEAIVVCSRNREELDLDLGNTA